MKTLFVVSCVVLLMNCSYKTRKEGATSGNTGSFADTVVFELSFMPPSRISIVTNDSVGQIHFAFRSYSNIPETDGVEVADSAELSRSDVRYFLNTLDTISLLNMRSDSAMGLDGIVVHTTCYQDSVSNTFHFWSPNKGSKEHRIVEAVLGLARLKFTTMKQQEYIESLEQYFDFGLPCKQISDNPYEVRIYGVLSSKEEKDLTSFLDAIPSDRPVVIDMTNFEGMGTMFYPLFKRLIHRNPNIVWATRDKRQLHEIGVDTTKIATDIETARRWMR